MKLYITIYSHRQNIWNKVKKPSKVGQEQKTLITAHASFLATIKYKSLISGGKTGHYALWGTFAL